MINSFIDEYLIEILDFPRYGKDQNMYCIKAFFKYDSNTPRYSVKETIIPVSFILNKQDIPDYPTIEYIINNSIPVIKRVIDYSIQKESWILETNVIEELKK